MSSSKYSPCRKIFKLEHNYCVNNLYFEKNYYSQKTENMKLRKTKFKEDSNTTNIKNLNSFPVLEGHLIMKKSKSMKNINKLCLLENFEI